MHVPLTWLNRGRRRRTAQLPDCERLLLVREELVNYDGIASADDTNGFASDESVNFGPFPLQSQIAVSG